MAGTKVLATNVHVEHEGESVLLEAGSELPKWARELVTNPAAFVPEGEADQEEPDPGSDEAKGYADQTVDELTALLKERELPTSGNKAELVARLTEADQEEPDPGSDS
jgi:hypothetical protein